MRAEDIEKLISVGRPDIAPDGSFAVFAASRPDLAANRAVGQLWRVDLPDGTPRRLTRGTADAAPRLSPDGSRIAFLRADAQGQGAGLRRRRGRWRAGAGDGRRARRRRVRLVARRRGARLHRAGPRERAATARSRGWMPRPRRRGTSPASAGTRTDSATSPTGRRTLFVVDAPETDAEPFYEPAAAVRRRGRAAAEEADRRARRHASSPRATRRYSGVVFAGDEILTVRRRDRVRRAATCARALVAVRADGSGRARGARPRCEPLDRRGRRRRRRHDRAPRERRGRRGHRLHRAGRRRCGCSTAAVPRRLTDAETIDLGEVGSHITPVGDDFLVQDRTRGRRAAAARHALRARSTEVLGGDVEVAGHAAAGDRIVAAVATPDSFGELVARRRRRRARR